MVDDLSDLDPWIEAYIAGKVAIGRLLPVLRRAEARLRGTWEPAHCALRQLYVSVDEAADAVNPDTVRRAVLEAIDQFRQFHRVGA